MAVQLDEDVISPADFCVMGIDMHMSEGNNYSGDAIEKEIIDKLKLNYDAEVEYVNPCFKIQDFYKWTEEYNNLQKLKRMVEIYCGENGIKGK